MKIKAIKKMPRKLTIPGNLTSKKYRQLQSGDITEVDQACGDYLISKGFAEASAAVSAKKDNDINEGGKDK